MQIGAARGQNKTHGRRDERHKTSAYSLTGDHNYMQQRTLFKGTESLVRTLPRTHASNTIDRRQRKVHLNFIGAILFSHCISWHHCMLVLGLTI